MNNPRLVPTILLLSALAFTTGTALGAANLPDGTERVLNGHGFIPSNFLGDPFVGTYFANQVGGGLAIGVETPLRDLDGNTLATVEGDLLYGVLGLEYQQNLGSVFAVGIRGAGVGRTGTSAQSFIAEGADLRTEKFIWGKWRAVRSNSVQAALGLNWGYRTGTFFTPREFAQHIADGGDLGDAPIVTEDKSWETSVAYDVAWAVSPMFGLRLSGNSGIYEAPGSDSATQWLNRWGLLGSLDLNQTRNLPLGFTLGYFWGTPENEPPTALRGLLLGFWYTGETDLQLGVEMGLLKTQFLGTDEDVDGQFAILTTRYYF